MHRNQTGRSLLTLTLLCLVVARWAGAWPGSAGAHPGLPERRVVVLHTNDLHGQVLPRLATWLKDVNPVPDSGGLPRLAGHLRRVIREETAAGAAVVVVDGGDWFQGTPEGQLDRGLGFLHAFGAAGHDAAVVGNHEFDHGLEVLLGHLEAARLPALLANVRMPDGTPLPGTRSHLVVERAGLRIGLVGLLTITTPSITHTDTRALLWESPASALERIRASLEGEVDLLIPVTHMGIEEDLELARALPDLPLIVGGHSHSFLKTGVREGGTLIVQAGAKASVIGRVDLWLDDNAEVVRSEARHIELYGGAPDADRNREVESLCADLVDRAAARMDQVVGVLGADLGTSRRPLVSTGAGNLIADAIRRRAGADVALHNRGGIRTSLLAGPVTRRDLFMLLPFDNHVTAMDLPGDALLGIFREAVANPRRTLEFSGALLRVDEREGRAELQEVIVGGEPLRPEATYRVATNSFMAGGGDGWDVFEGGLERQEDFVTLRDLLEAEFAGGVLVPSGEQRYEINR